MKPIYTIRFPAPLDDVEFTDEERKAILVSRARSLRDVIERHGSRLALIFHEEDVGIMTVALEQFVDSLLKMRPKEPTGASPEQEHAP